MDRLPNPLRNLPRALVTVSLFLFTNTVENNTDNSLSDQALGICFSLCAALHTQDICTSFRQTGRYWSFLFQRIPATSQQLSAFCVDCLFFFFVIIMLHFGSLLYIFGSLLSCFLCRNTKYSLLFFHFLQVAIFLGIFKF